MILVSFFVPLAYVALVAAQTTDTNNNGIQIEAIEAHFANSGITPSLLPTFTPSAFFTLSFNGVQGNVEPGTALAQDQVQSAPNLIVTAANSSVSFSGNYTLAMVDAGAVGFDESLGQTRHWLVNGVTISSNLTVNTETGTAITEYAGPAPPIGSGAHRYVILIYVQPLAFTPPANLSSPNTGVSTFDFVGYVRSSNLGPLLAATYFTVENGTATSTPSATSPVISSTLAPISTSSASGSAVQSSQTASSNSASKSVAILEPITFLLGAVAGLLLA